MTYFGYGRELQSKVVYGQIQHNELRWWRFL